MARRSSITRLPLEVRRWLERALQDNGFSGYEELEALLRERGYVISKSAIHRYGKQIEEQFASMRAVTEVARIFVDGQPDDGDARSAAIIALVQSELFECMIKLREANKEGVNVAAHMKLLSTAAKNIASVSRASVVVNKFRLEVQERAEAAAASVEKIAHQGGLSLASVAEIRRAILGVAG